MATSPFTRTQLISCRLPKADSALLRSSLFHHLCRFVSLRQVDSLREKANPPIDLPQPPLAVLIVGVFTAIAVAGSPRHHLRHGRAFPGEQKPVLIFEALQPAPRYVVLASRRGLVPLWFSRKPFPHLVVRSYGSIFMGERYQHSLRSDWQMTDACARGGEDSICNRRCNRRNRRFTKPNWIARAGPAWLYALSRL